MRFFRAYRSSILLVASLVCGALFGVYFPEQAKYLEPIGAMFLNLLFTIIVPLVAVSVITSIASLGTGKHISKVLFVVFSISVIMAVIGASIVVVAACMYNPVQGVNITIPQNAATEIAQFDIVTLFTTSDFINIFSKNNMLPLIVICILVGLAITRVKEQAQPLLRVLDALYSIIMQVVSLIMCVAPIGLGAFFAALMATQDIAVLRSYFDVFLFFTIVCCVYFFVGSTIYAYIAGGKNYVVLYWKNITEPATTALGTCSSLATLPITIRSAYKMSLPKHIADICIPLFANINKGGVAMTIAIDVVFLYTLLGIPFTLQTFLVVLLLSIFSAVMVGGIPGGGFLGEIFTVTTLGLPTETIPLIILIGTITDATATLINVVHNLSATQLATRFLRNTLET